MKIEDIKMNYFWTHVDRKGADGCWLWAAARCKNGYGVYRSQRVHRVSWHHERGPIPAGLTIDHICRVRLCVNPNHLRVLTNSENASDNGNRRKTHCHKGHEFTPENTYLARSGGGRRRVCLTCRAEWKREWRAKQHLPPVADQSEESAA